MSNSNQSPAEFNSMGSFHRRRILFKMTGSIACFKACSLISKLKQTGYEVKVAASASALKFVGLATLEGLTSAPVFTDVFECGRAMDHINLSRWADLTLLCPASAGAINRLSQGLADDVIGTLFLAHDFSGRSNGPSTYWIVPAMNTSMWNHPATRSSMTRLQSWGVKFINPDTGPLACGEVGEGRMTDPLLIEKEINDFFLKPPSFGQDKPLVLITAGATRAPIDSVRFISNFSTGETASAIADSFSLAGFEVHYLHGKGAKLPTQSVNCIEFETFEDLDQLIKDHLSKHAYRVMIHAAAVGDYSVKKSQGKLPSDQRLTLELTPNFKIVEKVRFYASKSVSKDIKLIAFKLTDGGDETAQVQSLISRSGAEFVVHNRRSEITSHRHMTSIYDSEGHLVAHCASKSTLAQTLLQLLLDRKSISKKSSSVERIIHHDPST